MRIHCPITKSQQTVIDDLNKSIHEDVYLVYKESANSNRIVVKLRTTGGFEYSHIVGKRGALYE